MERRGTGCGPIQNPLYTFARRIAEKDFTNGIAAYPRFLRQTFHEWAGHSIQASEWARRYYDELLSRGKRHHAAVRSLAYKWIRILFRCWKNRVPYVENFHLGAVENEPRLPHRRSIQLCICSGKKWLAF
jgi:hypothetical protein